MHIAHCTVYDSTYKSSKPIQTYDTITSTVFRHTVRIRSTVLAISVLKVLQGSVSSGEQTWSQFTLVDRGGGVCTLCAVHT